MMLRTKAWGVCALVLLAGCAKHTAMEQTGGETNWLRGCTSDAQCGASSCLCGVCTSECDLSTDCPDEAGSCIASSSPIGDLACRDTARPPRALCLPECDGDRSCAEGWACRDSVCVLADVAERFDDELSVHVHSTGGTGGAGGSGSTDPARMSLGAENRGEDAGIITCYCDQAINPLDCVCWEIGAVLGGAGCPTLSEALIPDCGNRPPEQDIKVTGCGMTLTQRRIDGGVMTLVYSGERLVGAEYEKDIPFGLCEEEMITSYKTEIPDLTTCDDFTICSLCGAPGMYEACDP